jgi:hypothetical protein
MFFVGDADCPLCAKKTNLGTFAIVSPWIREMGIKSRLSRYFICQACETGFFSKRYNDKEMAGIYRDYRGEIYLKIRSKWEPWYTSRYNQNHDSQAWINSRKESITNFLSSVGILKCNAITDVGGDRGQYIPEITSKKIVIDISEKVLHGDVQRVRRIEDSPKVDLILYAHVLEHVTNPIQELKKLFEKSNQVYVEVPFGVPEINKYRKSLLRLTLQFLSALWPRFWALSATPATGRTVRPTKILAQSEHLTFFSEKSLEVIAQELQVKCVIQRNTISTPDLNTGTVLQCLLVLNDTGN